MGSNLGEKAENIRLADVMLAKKLDITARAGLYHSHAMLEKGSPQEWDVDFYNTVLCGNTNMAIHELLKFSQSIEQSLGGKNKGTHAPRVIDVDIISFNDMQFSDANITVPHAKMLERGFVMLPLAEILPQWRHPITGEQAHESAKRLSADLGVKRI